MSRTRLDYLLDLALAYAAGFATAAAVLGYLMKGCT
jgi:hypothetical protein